MSLPGYCEAVLRVGGSAAPSEVAILGPSWHVVEYHSVSCGSFAGCWLVQVDVPDLVLDIVLGLA